MSDNLQPAQPAAPPPSTASASSLKSFQEQYKFVQPKPKTPRASSRLPLPPPTASNFHLFVKAGLPLLLFSVGASVMLKSGVEGRNIERDKSKGFVSKSERQARLDAERDQMMEKLNKRIKTVDFDNTKRIERPEEILERRKKEREDRNRWYKRTWRWLSGSGQS
ncbi:hypothetical protein ACHAWU_008461 [Discostella pseudostelligera]|uniref:Uncharacterized protein n=1 Tax=Discostella pseudostelligera TaxID=259834 RepID=A0ABD3LZW9_9STRA